MKAAKPAEKISSAVTPAHGLSEAETTAFRLMRETLEADLAEEYDDTDTQVLRPANGTPRS